MGMAVAHLEHVMECGWLVRCAYCCLVTLATVVAPLIALFLMVSNV
jgi:hypothetical protein